MADGRSGYTLKPHIPQVFMGEITRADSPVSRLETGALSPADAMNRQLGFGKFPSGRSTRQPEPWRFNA
jgi:hypothetical protein